MMKWHHWYATGRVNLRSRRQTYCRYIFWTIFFCAIPISISLSWLYLSTVSFEIIFILCLSLSISFSFCQSQWIYSYHYYCVFSLVPSIIWLESDRNVHSRIKKCHTLRERKRKKAAHVSICKGKKIGRKSAYRGDDRRHPRRHITTTTSKKNVRFYLTWFPKFIIANAHLVHSMNK